MGAVARHAHVDDSQLPRPSRAANLQPQVRRVHMCDIGDGVDDGLAQFERDGTRRCVKGELQHNRGALLMRARETEETDSHESESREEQSHE